MSDTQTTRDITEQEKEQFKSILQEIRNEQHPIEDDETLIGYIKKGEYAINYRSGAKIDYEIDLKARSLLIDYVLYARYKRLAEFKQLNAGEYAELQAKYYKPTDLQ